jgi:hypothetical protein
LQSVVVSLPHENFKFQRQFGLPNFFHARIGHPLWDRILYIDLVVYLPDFSCTQLNLSLPSMGAVSSNMSSKSSHCLTSSSPKDLLKSWVHPPLLVAVPHQTIFISTTWEQVRESQFKGNFPYPDILPKTGLFPTIHFAKHPHLMSSFTFCIPFQNCDPPYFCCK